MYLRTWWKDHIVNPPNRWKHTRVDDSTFDVQRAGEVMQEGTNQDASHFNNLEEGVSDASVATALLIAQMGQVAAETTAEKHTVTLKNTAAYPFNNSAQSVALTATRGTEDYDVVAEVQSGTGNVGDIHITDKKVNGFKVAFDGSAKEAVVKLRITGGM